MEINVIDGYLIYNFFISGAKNLIYSEQNLNSINVFPVADGDTGTNLALTMKTIILQSKKDQSVNRTLNSISEIAIENAYGNREAYEAFLVRLASAEDEVDLNLIENVTGDEGLSGRLMAEKQQVEKQRKKHTDKIFSWIG